MVYYSLFNSSQMDSLVSSCWVDWTLASHPSSNRSGRAENRIRTPTPYPLTYMPSSPKNRMALEVGGVIALHTG